VQLSVSSGTRQDYSKRQQGWLAALPPNSALHRTRTRKLQRRERYTWSRAGSRR